MKEVIMVKKDYDKRDFPQNKNKKLFIYITSSSLKLCGKRLKVSFYERKMRGISVYKSV